MSSDNAPAVNCPIHGTHGVLSHGACWYCVQAGVAAPEAKPKKKPIASGKLQKRKIA